MFLKHLSLNNLRCFEQAELDFDLPGGDNRKWTVLLGENGTGKSTVLKSVALVMAGSNALTELVGETDSWIRAGADSGSIVAQIETAKGQEREISLEFRRGEDRQAFFERAHKTLEPLDAALEHTTRSYLTVAYGASRRLTSGPVGYPTDSPVDNPVDSSVDSPSSSGFKKPRARSVASLFDRQAELNPLENWALKLDDTHDGSRLEVVRNVLSDFLSDIVFSHVDKEQGRLMFTTPDGVVPLHQLSDGYQNVAAWVGDLLYQITSIFEDYKQPLNARGLLMIDVVDLHLHPIWQRRLLHFLTDRLPRMQLVVTTYSVVTAQQSVPTALHYCIRRSDGLKIEQFDGDPRNFLLNQLIATEAFGNASDESLSVERDKATYRELHNKETKTPADRKKMDEIADRIGQRPDDDTESVFLSKEQRKLMEKMQARYQSGES